MRYITTAFLLIWSTTALATGKPNDTTRTSSSAVSSSVSGPSRSSAHNFSKNKNTNTASANVGDTTATGGAASSISKSGDSNATSGDSEANVSVAGDEEVRQAPGVFVAPPQSTSKGLKCFGAGISMAQDESKDAYGGGFGWCWRARDAWAVERAEFMAAGGEYKIAAKEYCSKPFHRGPFQGDNWRERRDNCESTVAKMYYRRANPVEPEDKVTVDQCDSEKAVIVGRIVEECKGK